MLFSCIQLFATLWIAAYRPPLSMGFPRQQFWSGLPFPSPGDLPDPGIKSTSPFAFIFFPQHKNLFIVSLLRIRWSKYWSFSFSISPSNEYSGLISFRMEWLDLLAVQGTLKSLLQHHTSKASILALSFLYSPTLTSIHDHRKNHSFD